MLLINTLYKKALVVRTLGRMDSEPIWKRGVVNGTSDHSTRRQLGIPFYYILRETFAHLDYLYCIVLLCGGILIKNNSNGSKLP